MSTESEQHSSGFGSSVSGSLLRLQLLNEGIGLINNQIHLISLAVVRGDHPERMRYV